MDTFKELIAKMKHKRAERKILKAEYKKKRKEYRKSRSIVYRVASTTISFIIKTLTWIFGITVLIAIAVALLVSPYIIEARNTAYDSLKNVTPDFFKLNSNTLIYDDSDNIICEVNSGSFKYAKISDISNYITDGYIAVEDKNFKSHPGIDIRGITRAALAYIENKGKITQGGSTITQQLIKNTMLSQKQTFRRKIAELFIAIDFEARPDVTKELIMEYYVNTNFYGNNRYGIESACNYYFNCSAKDVTPAQAAMLIGISNAPSKYNPVANYDLCIEKANSCLTKMYENGAITEVEYNKAKEDLDNGIEIEKHTEDLINEDNYLTTYALHCATIKLMENNNFKFEYTFNKKEEENNYNDRFNEEYSKWYTEIHNGGYEIHTALNLEAQEELQRVIDEKLSVNTEVQDNGIYALQSAAVVIDNSNNYVIAIVGGRSESGEYNRGYQAARQPGSSIKPILDYGPAFDTGEYYPSKIVEDGPIPGDYQPKNWYSGYRGNVSIRYAIEQSINTVACKALLDVGVSNGIDYLAKMKFSNLSYADYESSTIAIGGFTYGTTPYEMAKAYNTMQNNGEYSDRTCIKTLSKLGEIVYNSAVENKTEVYTADTSYMVTSCLKSDVTNGLARASSVDGQVVAGKTGTTNSSKDIWYCGYTKYYTAAIWIGYDTPKEITLDNNTAQKIFKEFMTTMHSEKPEADWQKPDTVIESYVDYKGEMCDYDTGRTDYFSTINNKQLKVEQNDEAFNKATIALEEFEDFSINSIATMKEYYSKLNNVKSLIDKVTDEYNYSQLNKRLSIKKESLDKQYKYYKDIYDSDNKYNEEKQSLANKQAEEEASRKADEIDAENKINIIKSYIEQLENSKIYSNTEKNIEHNTRELLEQIKNSNSYTELNNRFNSVINELKNKVEKPTEHVTKAPENTTATTQPSSSIQGSNIQNN